MSSVVNHAESKEIIRMTSESEKLKKSSIERWRRETPGCGHRVHLNNAGAALMTQEVADTIKDYLDLELNMGGYEAADQSESEIADAYQSTAKLIGARADQIAMVENATVATSQALSAFTFKPGDVILTTNVDYSSNQIMLLSLSKRYGVDIIRAEDDPVGGVDPHSVRKLIRKHSPKLMLMSWIPTNSGLVQDAESVGAICREQDVPYILDACQAVGQIPVDVSRLNCDFLAATSRKFLRGPRGIGFLYVSERMLHQNMHPLFPDTHGARWTAPDSYQLQEGAKRFENWEFPYALVLGMGKAAEYAVREGINLISSRAISLGKYARQHLRQMDNVRVLDYGKQTCAIVSARIKDVDAGIIVQKLREKSINTSAASRTAGVIDMDVKKAETVLRISPHYYNTVEEIDRLIHELNQIN